MQNIMVIGAGKIGSLIACLLNLHTKDCIFLADISFETAEVKKLLAHLPNIQAISLDVTDEKATADSLKNNKITAVISSLPFYLNLHVARAASQAKVTYFDLTEDTHVTEQIGHLAQSTQNIFVPQCGLAPGFVGIVAHDLIEQFDECLHAHLRVGALPQFSRHLLHYSLTWSTEGVINEYGNLCEAIENGNVTTVKPLEGLEPLELDGDVYEAFNTSGGLGSLTKLYQNKIQTLNYKTIRYPGHNEKIRFLMNDLKLNDDRKTLKAILEKALPRTYQDVVLIYVNAQGIEQDVLIEKSYVKKIYPQSFHALNWSAIQVATAAGVCAVMETVLKDKSLKGLVLQEQISLKAVLASSFGQYFA